MSFATVQKIADAVLFEGYILYPYRPSAIKNRQRWNFGTLYPRDFAQAQRAEEPSSFHSEIIVEGSPDTSFDLCIRFLQLIPPAAADNQDWDRGVVRNWTIQGVRMVEILNGLNRTLYEEDLAIEAASAAT